ncbi:hypothetical protein P152DRAFT_454508 [Eremomyces bilateralis CBS 781.70]|uniref:RING-type E3 ubiquitin transferase n=1 Tax=Eremomyces bilateralis CBS 781.70 TaxID=1392243 RepID=A0A6G1GEF1_9PEZI|nr:uncharacterized protein P152DRAFT_454508 [Eremomyces bilateralis CBS 781.70]KAF1816249.1 hypothetical protein P152DRAFT_454508 [Eremomyces bilateralis CBS 781.70]
MDVNDELTTRPSPRSGSAAEHPNILMDGYNENNIDKSPQEGDTCRICRGEGSKEEPLFYPCKCSGTIKFVHQACLMEWLVHSQKKYCELCKTPFRFTKLYHPKMPRTLPISIFLRKAGVHIARHFVTWCRALLVAFAWLIAVPYAMRCVWRLLFWLADGGWTRDSYFLATSSSHNNGTLLGSSLDNGTSPARWNATSAKILPAILAPVSQTLNMTSTEPTIVRMVRRLINFYTGSDQSNDLGADRNSTVALVLAHSKSSLLSEISLLTHITPYPLINQLLIDVIEGQLITALIVIGFILIFLIREWVVQQQPAMELARDVAVDPERAGGFEGDDQPEIDLAAADAENADNNDDIAVAPPPETDNVTPPGLIEGPSQVSEQAEASNYSITPITHLNPAGEANPPLGHGRVDLEETRRRVLDLVDSLPWDVQQALIRGGSTDIIETLSTLPAEQAERIRSKLRLLRNSDSDAVRTDNADDISHADPTQSSVAFEDETASTRPDMPVRNRSFIATDVQRSLEEETPHGAPEDNSRLEVRDEELSRGSSDSSWQDVSGVVDDEGETSSPSVSTKGKERAADDVPAARSTEPLVESGNEQETDDTHTRRSEHVEPPLPSAREPEGPPQHDNEPRQVMEDIDDTALIPNGAAQDMRPAQRAVRQQNAGHSLFDRTLDWLWGDVAPVDRPDTGRNGDRSDDEIIVDDSDDGIPFVPFQDAEPVLAAPVPEPQPRQDAGVVAAAAEAGIDINDPDDDADDLEGLLELIGMQGPIVALFEHATFTAIIVASTVVLAVWLPYTLGKLVLLVLGSPPSALFRVPFDIVTRVAEILLDLFIFVTGLGIWLIINAFRSLLLPLKLIATFGTDSPALHSIPRSVEGAVNGSSQRLIQRFGGVATSEDSDYLWFSLASHVALRSLQAETKLLVQAVADTALSVTSALETTPLKGLPSLIVDATVSSLQWSAAVVFGAADMIVATVIKKPQLDGVTKPSISAVLAADPSLAYWSGWDRGIAIFWGYSSVAFAGAMYLKRGLPFTSSQQGRRVEAHVRDFIQQAGGVMKVMVIIGIEMIVFPLYCGLLLDFALLPLFEDTTVYSRVHWSINSLWTSGFVHWFIGTCYMFHFAQFVSMCRKIMRKGVLYFIRDPDDPTFHPVRDVLERNVTTQLRKIAFSALVYGALVVVCLGGVVWALYYAFDAVLPIHWASSESSLEFPLDILVFNFITPLVMRRTRPTDGLQTMYKWWFHWSARALRLSNFLLGEKRLEEEWRPVGASFLQRIGLRKYLPGEPAPVQLKPDGRMVLAPGSDQLRIPKGQPVFRDIGSSDGENGQSNGDTSRNRLRRQLMFTEVYIPSNFRLRISLFVLAIWIFAAATGVGVTIVPLVFGRYLCSSIFPQQKRINDIYAFAAGFYSLGGVVYGAAYIPQLFRQARASVGNLSPRPLSFLSATKTIVARVIACLYVYSTLAIALPLLFALVLELYLLIPIHTFACSADQRHSIHLVQDWTLGILYVRIAFRYILSTPGSRSYRALTAVVREGWLNPNAYLATRGFILPVSIIFSILVLGPGVSAMALARAFPETLGVVESNELVRFAYPVAAGLACHALVIWALGKAMHRWRARIKDEAYLVGERLHNFGDRRPLAVAQQS